jgi:hypothetical protein
MDMQDDMDAEAVVKGKGKGGRKGGGKGAGKAAGKSGGEGPKSAEVQIARMVVRAQWQQEWSAANPDGGQAERKAAWKEARQTRMEQNMKPVRKMLSSLQRQGVTMTLSEAAASADPDGDGGDDDSEG